MSIQNISRILVQDIGGPMYFVEFTIDGIAGNYSIPEKDANTDQEALYYLDARYADVLETTKIKFGLNHGIPVEKLNKIEHPNFTIEWDSVNEKVKLIDKTGTVQLSDLESRITTLEAVVIALEAKP